MQYTWDPKKAAENIKKHKVSFDEAISAIEDPNSVPDNDDANGELRLIIIGWSEQARLLFVVCIEHSPNHNHIISARKAQPKERKRYESQNKK